MLLQISKNFDAPMYPEPDTSLAELVAAGLMQFIKRIEEVSVTATKEFALEETLHRMQSEWSDVRFEFLPYRYLSKLDSMFGQSWFIPSIGTRTFAS